MFATSILLAFAIIPQPEALRTYGDAFIPVSSPIVEEYDAAIAPEGYLLHVDQRGKVLIRSSDAAGAFYARQTLK